MMLPDLELRLPLSTRRKAKKSMRRKCRVNGLSAPSAHCSARQRATLHRQ